MLIISNNEAWSLHRHLCFYQYKIFDIYSSGHAQAMQMLGTHWNWGLTPCWFSPPWSINSYGIFVKEETYQGVSSLPHRLKDKFESIKISIHWYPYHNTWTHHHNDVEEAYPDLELRSSTLMLNTQGNTVVIVWREHGSMILHWFTRQS